jgi:hypothetical protein
MPTDNLSLQVASHWVASTALHLTPLHVQRVFFVFLMSLDLTHLRIIYVSRLDSRQRPPPRDQRKQSRRWHGIRFREDYRPIDKG